MQIKINTQHLTLNEGQEERIHSKIEKLTTLAGRLSDESSEIKVDLIYEQARRVEDAYVCHITFFVPGDTLRAEARHESLENAVDEVIDKLKPQIEHYKARP